MRPDQIRLCIKVAAQSNDPKMLTELFDKHLKGVENYYRKKEVTSVMPNLIVSCSVDDHVDALRVLLKQGEVSYDTFKGAFLRAAADGASKAIEVLINHHKGEIDFYIGTDAIITAHRAGHDNICYYLLYLPKVLHDPENRDIIKILAELDDEESVDVTDADYSLESIYEPVQPVERDIPVAAPIPAGPKYQSSLMKEASGQVYRSELMRTLQSDPVGPVEDPAERHLMEKHADPEPVQSGWSMRGAISSLTQMAQNMATNMYNGIPSVITYDKKETDELFK